MEKKKKDPGQELRTIKLFCPSLSTIAPFVASLDQCIDIGSIATIFGLEPSTVKLNGHFLSRGLDLVSSVTWNSLLSFFSAKRLPIGGSDDDALVVDGKLSKIGVKSEFFFFSSSDSRLVDFDFPVWFLRKARETGEFLVYTFRFIILFYSRYLFMLDSVFVCKVLVQTLDTIETRIC